MMRRSAPGAALLLIVLISTSSTTLRQDDAMVDTLASPYILMFHGETMERPAFLVGPEAVAHFLMVANEGAAVHLDSLKGRPSLAVTAFWNARVWASYEVDTAKLRTLRPEHAADSCPTAARDCVEAAIYYPEFGSRDPVLIYDSYIPTIRSTLAEEARRALQAAGVPVKAPESRRRAH